MTLGLFGFGTELLLWVLGIVMILLSIYATGKWLVIGVPNTKIVHILWIITIAIFVVLLLDGFVEYIMMNKEMGLVVGVLIGLYIWMFPVDDNKKKW
jgi:hypothetical protein